MRFGVFGVTVSQLEVTLRLCAFFVGFFPPLAYVITVTHMLRDEQCAAYLQGAMW